MNDIPESGPILQQFDQVELLTVRNVDYLSARPGFAPSPHGIWSVIGLVAGKVLLAKDGTLIRIPLNDIRKVSSYSPSQVLAKLKEICYGQKAEKEDPTASGR